jgi:hypothetical protein
MSKMLGPTVVQYKGFSMVHEMQQYSVLSTYSHFTFYMYYPITVLDGPGIESQWGEIFRCPDRPWGPPSLLYNGYRVFPGGKLRLGRAVDHSPPSNAAVKKGYSYTSTHPQGHLGL